MDKRELKAVRLKVSLIETIEGEMDKENRNFSNMVETMLLDYIRRNCE